MLAFVSERGTAHPREVDAHFAHGKVVNWFGGTSNASTRLLDDMHHHGWLRVRRREAGTRGHDRAAAYMAARFRQLGLEPAGDDGDYLQRVPLLRAVRGREGAALVLHRDGRDHALAFADEFLPAPDFNRAYSTVTAPAVFVGQGIQAPEAGLDDFAGLELRGRIAGLRVVDAGAMPAITSGNTNSPTLMMAEKAAAWVRESAA